MKVAFALSLISAAATARYLDDRYPYSLEPIHHQEEHVERHVRDIDHGDVRHNIHSLPHSVYQIPKHEMTALEYQYAIDHAVHMDHHDTHEGYDE